MRAGIAFAALFLTQLQRSGTQDQKHVSLRRLLRCVIVSLGVVTGQALGLSQPISATECIPQDQLTEEYGYVGRLKDECVVSVKKNGNYNSAELLDKTIWIYGNNKKHEYITEIPKITAPTTPNSRIISILDSAGVSKQELLELTFKALAQKLRDIQDTKDEFTYETTDKIFTQLLDIMPAIDWSRNDETDSNQLHGSLISVTLLGRYYGKKYGLPVIDLLQKLYVKYPQSRRLKHNVPWSLSAMIDAESPYPSENPTIKERITFAQILLEFYRTHPEYDSLNDLNFGSFDAYVILENNAPQLLEQFKEIFMERAAEMDANEYNR